MTTESMRIAIAEACEHQPELTWHVMDADEKACCMSGEKWACEEWLAKMQKDCPDSRYSTYHVGAWKHYKHYDEDLNTRGAMLEVIVDKELTKDFEQLFSDKWHALTVPQRDFCEKFLSTIGKWIES